MSDKELPFSRFGDAPKMFADPINIEARMKLLYEPHIHPLTTFVQRLAEVRGGAHVPYFDPWDGGVEARYLFLLEAPGPKAGSSGFISRSNNDESARNMFEIQRAARLDRSDTLLWNIVPWYMGPATLKPRRSDIDEGYASLQALIALLPRLEAVILMGGYAQRVYKRLLRDYRYRVIKTFHPSPMALNRKPGRREAIVDSLVALMRAGTCN